MKNTRLYRTGHFLIPAAVLLMCSCEHKELCYDHSHTSPVNIVFDWSEAPDASPAGMDVYFFPDNGDSPQRFALGKEGGSVELAYGTYRVLCFNNDTRTIRRSGTESWDTFKLYTRDAGRLEGMGAMLTSTAQPPTAEGTEDQRCTLSPDMIWSDRMGDIEVTPAESGSSAQTVTLHPRQTVTHITFEVVDAKNLDQATALSGTLSGLSAGLYIGRNEPDAECVTMPFPAAADSETSLQGAFNAFGHCPDGDNGIPHKFVIYAVLKDGSQLYYTYDVTDQMHQAPDRLNIHLRLEGLPLPTPVGGDGGMNPDVDEWNNVNIDLDM